jgi:ATP-binding cassette, subfamily C, bacterial LapB
MIQLLLFLKNNKFQSLWIIISSLLINLLALSSALYVIQVFNRYLSYKLNATLTALTLGVLMAFSIELVLRIIRSFLVNKLTIVNFRKEALKKINILISLKINTNKTKGLLDEINPLNHVDINKAEILIGFIDVFFVIIFLSVIFILSFKLGVLSFIIACGFAFILYLKSNINFFLNSKIYKLKFKANTVINDLKNSALTIRAFNAGKMFNDKFRLYYSRQRALEKSAKNTIGFFSSINIMLPILSTIIIIFYGAQEVTAGNLTIGALVGINILNSRVFGPINRISTFTSNQYNNKTEYGFSKKSKNIEYENVDGISPKIIKGDIRLKDLAIGFNSNKNILFQRLNCIIPSGSITVINGYNSSGKSSLCNSFLGLVTPLKGNILYDNIDLKNLNIANLRKNICFLPQEIDLLNITIKENILLNINKSSSAYNNDGILIKVINMVGLNNFINNRPKGIDTVIDNNGKSIPGGVRKRIGLARAIINDGKIVIFDEPTSSLDIEGIKKLYKILNDFRKLKKTIIIASHDQNIIKSAGIIIDLSTKPIPRIGLRKK